VRNPKHCNFHILIFYSGTGSFSIKWPRSTWRYVRYTDLGKVNNRVSRPAGRKFCSEIPYIYTTLLIFAITFCNVF
jgi:hypothetical protein